MLSDADLGFFSGFLDFKADKGAARDDEFARLARQRKWTKGSQTYKKYDKAFQSLAAIQNKPDTQEGRRENVMPKKDRKTADELTPDWILADVFKQLNIAGPTNPKRAALSMDFDLDDIESTDDGVVIGYFDKHPSFEVNRTAPIQEEFRRLAKEQKWHEDGDKFQIEYQACLDQELALLLSSGVPGYTVLQNLCKDVGADPVPTSNTQCNKYLANVYINIFDYINAKRSGEPVLVYTSRNAFRKYTRKDMIFPKSVAKKSKILSPLLERTFGYHTRT